MKKALKIEIFFFSVFYLFGFISFTYSSFVFALLWRITLISIFLLLFLHAITFHRDYTSTIIFRYRFLSTITPGFLSPFFSNE